MAVLLLECHFYIILVNAQSRRGIVSDGQNQWEKTLPSLQEKLNLILTPIPYNHQAG